MSRGILTPPTPHTPTPHTPTTQHPTPHTPHPTPHTPHPIPHTPHPTPHTRGPLSLIQLLHYYTISIPVGTYMFLQVLR